MSMWEPFTERARLSVVLAQENAQKLGHSYIGPEHMLLGLVDEASTSGEGGRTALLLDSLGLDASAVRHELEVQVEKPSSAPLREFVFTPHAKRVIEQAFEAARYFGHHYIGTEHLFLGLVRDEGLAGSALARHNVDIERARGAVATLPGVELRAQGTATVPPPSPGKVLVLAGPDPAFDAAMNDFLRAVGLTPLRVAVGSEPARGMTAVRGPSPLRGSTAESFFASLLAAQAVLVLFSPDPAAAFLAGAAFARAPSRTVAVLSGGVTLDGDFLGLPSVSFDGSEQSRRELLGRLAALGCAVKIDGTGWLRAGEFPAYPNA
jgi:hypothetical protein